MPQATFAIATSADDDLYFENDASWAVLVAGTGAGSDFSALNVLAPDKEFRSATNDFVNENGFMRWDTSSLPDSATIASALIRVSASNLHYDDARNLVADYYTWSPGGCTVADYTTSTGTSAISGIPLSSLSTGTVDLPLSGLSGINVSGYTEIRLGVDGGQPSGSNRVDIGTFDAGTPAQLIVYYYVNAQTDVALLNFGSFPGATDAREVVTGQTGISSSSPVQVELEPAATDQHTADEHRVENLAVYAGNVVGGTGFTIYGKSTDNTRLYGRWRVRWAWV